MSYENEFKIGKKIVRIYKFFQILSSKHFEDSDIKVAEFPFLLLVLENEGVCQEELASTLMVNKSAATKAVKSLVEKDYLVRKKDETDKRFYKVYSTPKGREVKESICEKINHLKTHMLSEFSEDELDSLDSLLEKVEKNLIKQCREFDICKCK
jgi:DNA-binding MarR family transcriptional regulator